MKDLQRFALCFPLIALVVLACPAFCQNGPPPLPVPIGDLNIWTLEQPDWLSTYGDTALGFTNLSTQPSWSDGGTALSVDTNGAAWLDLYVYEPYGWTNVVFDEGTISFWYQANWTSVADGGAGPTNWAGLLNIGQWSSNAAQFCWSLVIDPSGSNLLFLAQSNGNQQAISVPIDFDAGDWHDVALTYSASNFSLYLEGQLATNTAPITNWPSDEVCSNGLFIGSDATGIFQGRGQFQDLETYSYLLTPGEIAQNYSDISSIILNWGGTVPGSGFYTDESGPPNPGGGSDTNYVGSSPEGVTYTQPAFVIMTNYSSYTNFWLAISNSSTEVSVSVMSTLPGLTYVILTNDDLTTTNWGIWQVLLASNSITFAPPLALNSNALFFEGALEFSTGTNGLPDYWCMEYFGTVNVDPDADPDGDGLCNLAEYTFGTNPTNAHSISSSHKDAQALYLAYTNDPACHYQLFVTNADTNTVLVTMSNTLAGTNYQIYSQVISATNGPWIVETNFLGVATATTVAISLNGRSLNFVGGSGEDADGDGLPDGYEVLSTLTDPTLPDTGLTGTTDGYKDPDGDGYVNLQEYYNGTDPHVFNTPLGAQGLVADYTDGGNELSFSWQPASGPVLGYIIFQYNSDSGTWTPIYTNSPSQLTYLMGDISSYGGQFGIKTIYSLGSSSINSGAVTQHPPWDNAAIVQGPGGKTYIIASGLNTNVTGYSGIANYAPEGYPEVADYSQPSQYYLSDVYLQSNIDISAAQFTNGVAVMSDAQAPPFTGSGYDTLEVQTQETTNGGEASISSGIFGFPNVPFIDGTAQMKENIRFLLRAAGSFSFSYYVDGPGPFSFPSNHVYSTFYYVSSASYYPSVFFDNFAPFEDNYFFRNFAFSDASVTTNGTYGNGFEAWAGEYYGYTNPPAFVFPTYDYVTLSNQAPIPGILSSNLTQWSGYYSSAFITSFGAYGSLNLTNATNLYGLSYAALDVPVGDGTQFAALAPGGYVTNYTGGSFYESTDQPELRTVGYYFGRPGNPYSYYGPYEPADPLPGYQDGSFSVTNETPFLLDSVGTPLLIAGYAKQAVLNGNSNVFAYLGQYFTNAFVMSNGVVTTNPAGIVSEYGNFFPTVPGEIGLMTKPDPDQTNIQGTCIIDVIRLSLDVNHDGIMDETYTGPDNTSASAPFVFWANNDYDRWDIDAIDDIPEEDDQNPYVQNPDSFLYEPPDFNYPSPTNREIPCPRDLEDFARMWVSGVSNTLPSLPVNSTVTLNWGDVGVPNSSNPTIDLFQAADPDGGIGYLTNLITASNQINTDRCRYVGRLGPGSNILLNSSIFSNGWAGDHFIFCGVATGSGQLSLIISNGSGNILAQSSQYIQILDIKNMYERWTVGDDPGVPPQNIAVRATDHLPPGSGPFHYAYDPIVDTNDSYILSVHGYNIPLWEAEAFSETAYKRLYWQGYQGRFGSFRWPAHSNPLLFDDDEFSSWESGTGLYHLLISLNSYYPGKVYLFAHSQGNVAAGQALLMAGTNQIVNTYIAAQAAVAAHAYDSSTASRTPTSPFTYFTPDRYSHYWTNGAPSYFDGVSGAVNYINFFNTNDWALTLPWPFNQDTKPDESWKTFSLYHAYDYVGTNFYSVDQSIWGDTYNLLSFPTNTFTIFAYCDQAPCNALGAQNNVAGAFIFGTTYRQVELDIPPYSFGKLHIYHSGEFRSDNMQRWPFWNQVLVSYGLK